MVIVVRVVLIWLLLVIRCKVFVVFKLMRMWVLLLLCFSVIRDGYGVVWLLLVWVSRLLIWLVVRVYIDLLVVSFIVLGWLGVVWDSSRLIWLLLMWVVSRGGSGCL